VSFKHRSPNQLFTLDAGQHDKIEGLDQNTKAVRFDKAWEACRGYSPRFARSQESSNPFRIMIQRTVGPFKLWDWSFTTWDAMFELGLLEQSKARQTVAVAWMQSISPEEVEKHVAEGTALKEISKFKGTVDLPYLTALMEWYDEQSKAVEAGRVEVVPRPSSGDKDAPGN
jgi:hypothetical protein